MITLINSSSKLLVILLVVDLIILSKHIF